jgi:hypothetical protein
VAENDQPTSGGTGRQRADDVLLVALASGSTVEAAAAQADVSESTVYRRLTEPAFTTRLTQMRAAMVDRAIALISAAGAQAVRVLSDLLDEKEKPAVRLGAARAVLELGSKLRTEGDLAARLEAAERALGLRP